MSWPSLRCFSAFVRQRITSFADQTRQAGNNCVARRPSRKLCGHSTIPVVRPRRRSDSSVRSHAMHFRSAIAPMSDDHRSKPLSGANETSAAQPNLPNDRDVTAIHRATRRRASFDRSTRHVVGFNLGCGGFRPRCDRVWAMCAQPWLTRARPVQRHHLTFN